LRILLANYDLTRRGGTQLAVFDLAVKLSEWGHEPLVYSPHLGALADDIRNRGIPVVDHLSALGTEPEVIVGNHHLVTMTALQQYPSCPAIFVCHGLQWGIPKFPRIRRYVAVDGLTRAHLVRDHGIAEDSLETILNSVDLTRFRQREELPLRPRRALLFGNQFQGDGAWRTIVSVCRELGIEADVIGSGVGRTLARPETVLPQYDLVFARARSALEAMATGAAVILAGPTRMAGMVTPEGVAEYRPMNFGRGVLLEPISAEAIRREIARFDREAAREVSRIIRASVSLDVSAAEYLRVASDVLEEQHPIDRDAEYAATAIYLRQLENEPLAWLRELRERVAGVPVIGRLMVRWMKKAAGRP
jgi:hypothetical protein